MIKNLLTYFLIPCLASIPFEKVFAEDLIEMKSKSIKTLLSKKIINFDDIKNIISENNLELKSLEKLVKASSFNLSSKISKRYPSLDLNANGLPQYLYSRNYSNSSIDTKTSQVQINPSFTIRWDLIDPLRGLEIKSAKNNYEIAKNNYEIKKNDLIQEAKSRYHNYLKSQENAKNAKIAVDLSLKSLKDAQNKLDIGIGTKFDVLEADAQLSRDQQILEEKVLDKEINLISLKEILNINFEKEILISNKKKLTGYWNHPLGKNIKNGIDKSYSLKNIRLKGLIKKNSAKRFKNANLPSIYISNTLSSSLTQGSSLAANIDPSRSSSTYSNKISLNFTWNIFNGGQNNKSSQANEAEAESEKFSFLNLQNVIKKNISESYLNHIKSKQKIFSTTQEILATQESLRLARLRYEVGISTMKDVLIRQKELTNARSNRINAIYNYNISLDKLERLTFLGKSEDCKKNSNSQENQIYSICDY
tara:strand:+ start:20660 stop:22093 length:1434 start_codon:yes stop_codon:yes gene_type:complete